MNLDNSDFDNVLSNPSVTDPVVFSVNCLECMLIEFILSPFTEISVPAKGK